MAVRVGVVGIKGGTGRTELAFQMAERATNAGHKVKLLELQPLNYSLHYAETRRKMNLPLWECQARDIRLTPEKEDISNIDDMDLLICDFPQHQTVAAVRWMDWLDLLLAPINSSAPDQMVLTEMGHMAADRNWPFVFVPYMLMRSRSERLKLTNILEGEGFEAAPVQVGHSWAIPNSARYGRGVCEGKPRSSAAQDIDQLWQWLANRTRLETN